MTGRELRSIRKQLGISQFKLSENTKISQAKISEYELEKKSLERFELDTIVSLLNDIKNGYNIDTKKRIKKDSKKKVLKADAHNRSYQITERNKNYLERLNQLEKNFNESSNNKLKAVSFFAGCGGLCYGAKAAGFNIVATNELEESFKDIYELNFPDTKFLPNDIKDIKKNDILKALESVNEIDLMLGGPPCQGFSLAGKRDVDDERNSLFEYYIELAEIIKPKVILIENVKLLTTMKDPNGNYVKTRILEIFKKHKYVCDYFYINAKDYGVPQSRERVFFIAIREDIKLKPSIPSPTCNNAFSFGDAVSDLEYLESGGSSKIDSLHKAVSHPEHIIKWLINVPEGKSAHDNEDESLRPPSGYNTTYKRQIWKEPGKTVGTTFSMISGSNNVHPIATRSLTIREALRLQSFPDSFSFKGKQGSIRTTIGNAVPPLLAYEIIDYLKKNYIL